jgi:hypothetical protein
MVNLILAGTDMSYCLTRNHVGLLDFNNSFIASSWGGASFIDNSSGNVRQAKANNLTFFYMLYAY